MNIPIPLIVLIIFLAVVAALVILGNISDKRDAARNALEPKCENKACGWPSTSRVASIEHLGAKICLGCASEEIDRAQVLRHATHSH